MRVIVDIISVLRTKIYFLRLRMRNRKKSAKEIFSEYWHRNHWRNAESRSGDGSTLLYTENIRREIPLVVDRLHVSSILDAPCGDFNWFQHVKLRNGVSYIGGDIVEGMIGGLNKEYASASRQFLVVDVVSGKLPSVDLWICRDLIFHLPTKEIFRLIDNFIGSEIDYLLITSHADPEIINDDTFIGGFRLINLLNSPFYFPKPEEYIKDYIAGFPERNLLLYRRDALRAWKDGVVR